jgi:hypothetical protein
MPNPSRLPLAAALASLAFSACGAGNLAEDPSAAGTATDEVKGAPRCSVTPASPIVNQDYRLDIAGMRRDQSLQVSITDASGTTESALTSDSDGRASLVSRSSAVGAATAVVAGLFRGDYRESTRCSYQVVDPPICGDKVCNETETCSSCPGDCGACVLCGDKVCNGTETCSSCPGDCGACAPVCGDKACNGTETCSSCPGDCGACAPVCGDKACNGTETCSSCPGDCGACQTCETAATSFGSGHHNAGKACLNCHNGGTAIQWALAGTLYDTVSGTAAISGASIIVKDAAGRTVKLVTQANGNFYTSDTTLKFPLQVSASKCPNTSAMGSSTSSGNCNNCHASGNRIHLP